MNDDVLILLAIILRLTVYGIITYVSLRNRLWFTMPVNLVLLGGVLTLTTPSQVDNVLVGNLFVVAFAYMVIKGLPRTR